MAHPNEELVREGYEAFAEGDVQKAMESFADDIVWHVPGRSRFAGDYRGKEEVLRFFAETTEATGGTIRIELHDVLANDEHAIALVSSTAERDGKRWSSNQVHVYHVNADRKVTEYWNHSQDLYADDEFWG